MLIRKLFKFENSHIVRNCTTKKCSQNIHGHSYKAEILLESNYLDNGQMVLDFGLVKAYIANTIDLYDHSICIWSEDDDEYKIFAKKFSKRWVELPVNPSAEQLSRVIFLQIEAILKTINYQNGEQNVRLHSVIIHETDTGYAQCFFDDAHSKLMGEIDIGKIKLSDELMGSIEV